jgi:hypothetical protein
MHIVLFARDPKENKALPEFSACIFSALHLTEFEERESSNYPPDDRYFIGYASNASVKVCHSDDDDFAQYPYWVVLQSPRIQMDVKQSIPLSAEQVATSLAESGLEILVPSEGWGKVGWVPSGTVYGA